MINLAELDQAKALFDLKYAESRQLLGELVVLLEKEASMEVGRFIVEAPAVASRYDVAIQRATSALLDFGGRLQALGAVIVAEGQAAGARASGRLAAPPGRRH